MLDPPLDFSQISIDSEPSFQFSDCEQQSTSTTECCEVLQNDDDDVRNDLERRKKTCEQLWSEYFSDVTNLSKRVVELGYDLIKAADMIYRLQVLNL